jgi:hypothetical protein
MSNAQAALKISVLVLLFIASMMALAAIPFMIPGGMN